MPRDLAGGVVDRAQLALAPHAVVGAGPPVLSMLRLEEVDAVRVLRTDDEVAGLGIEAGRAIVGAATLVRRDQPAVARRLLRRVRDRLSVLVHAGCPVRRRERRGQQVLAV